MSDKPNPGTRDAIDQGCICPVMDNNNGEGIKLNGETVFWYTEGCPVHSSDSDRGERS